MIDVEKEEQRALGEVTVVPIEHSRAELQWSPDGAAVLVGMTFPPSIFFPFENSSVPLAEGSRALAWLAPQTLLVQQRERLLIVDQSGQEIVDVGAVDTFPIAWSLSHDGRRLAYATQRQIHVFDIEQQAIAHTINVNIEPIATLHWLAADSDVLIVDDGDWATLIWATSLNGERAVVVEKGLFLNFVPRDN